MRKAAATLAPGCLPAWSFAINRTAMKPATNRLLTGQRGMVLFTSLTILSVLLAVGIGVRTMLQNDYKVLTNLRSGTDVFYLAAAGIEWSKSEFGRTPALAPLPANRTLSFQSGTISVSFHVTGFARAALDLSRGAFGRRVGNPVPYDPGATHEDLRSCRCRLGAQRQRSGGESCRQPDCYFRRGLRSGDSRHECGEAPTSRLGVRVTRCAIFFSRRWEVRRKSAWIARAQVRL